MGILSGLFGLSRGNGTGSADADDAVGDVETALTCVTCGNEVDEVELETGECDDCYGVEYFGPKYCCGGIYQQGEDTCASCGEPL